MSRKHGKGGRRRGGQKAKNSYQRGDRFTQQARDEGYAARSVYKLQEIDRRTQIVPRRGRIVDLGCFPGSWSAWVLERLASSGTLVGVDFEAPELEGGHWIAESVFDVTPETILDALGGHADLVLSDMAQRTTGVRDADHYQQIGLARRALEVAIAIGSPGSGFVCKVFEGPEAQDFQRECQAHYKCRRIRPEAVRQNSREWFLVGTGKKTSPLPWAPPLDSGETP